MAQIRNTFDGGTPGTSMTTGNTGGASGTPFDAVEAAAVFSNEQAHMGLSMKPPTEGVSGYGRWQTGATRDIAIRTYIWMSQDRDGDYTFVQLRNGTSSSTTNLSLLINPVSHLRARTAADTNNFWTAAEKFPLGRWIRVEMLAEQGTGASTGRARVAYYEGESTTAIEDSGWITGLQMRGDQDQIANVYVGKTSTAEYSGNFYLDTFAADVGSDYPADFIGPHAPRLATPVVTLVGTSQASSPSATDGSATVSWPSVPNATRYIAEVAPGHGATSGFAVRSQAATSPYVFTNLAAGPHTLAITAHPDAL